MTITAMKYTKNLVLWWVNALHPGETFMNAFGIHNKMHPPLIGNFKISSIHFVPVKMMNIVTVGLWVVPLFCGDWTLDEVMKLVAAAILNAVIVFII